MGRRTNLAITIVAGGIILLIAIAVGNEMGNRVLGQATERGPAMLATPVATPVGFDPDPGDVNWRRNHVVSVATDPAFPDPRVTPPPAPTAPPTARYLPTAAAATPSPSPSPSRAPYPSPPLPIPLVSHAPDEGSPEPATPEATATP